LPLGIELSGGGTKDDDAAPASLACVGSGAVIQMDRAVAAAVITANITSRLRFIVDLPL
jgi:hypothetical protein